jgi:hypothetical protein
MGTDAHEKSRDWHGLIWNGKDMDVTGVHGCPLQRLTWRYLLHVARESVKPYSWPVSPLWPCRASAPRLPYTRSGPPALAPKRPVTKRRVKAYGFARSSPVQQCPVQIQPQKVRPGSGTRGPLRRGFPARAGRAPAPRPQDHRLVHLQGAGHLVGDIENGRFAPEPVDGPGEEFGG